MAQFWTEYICLQYSGSGRGEAVVDRDLRLQAGSFAGLGQSAAIGPSDDASGECRRVHPAQRSRRGSEIRKSTGGQTPDDVLQKSAEGPGISWRSGSGGGCDTESVRQ